MNRLELYVLCVCLVLSTAELLGPESRKDAEKQSEEEDSETLDTNPQLDPDYVKDLTDAVNKEIITLQEYADAIKKYNRPNKAEDIKPDQVGDAHLEQMEHALKLLRRSLLRQKDPAWVQEKRILADLDRDRKPEENPQDILDSLPPLPVEEKIELTPELQEAKELYDAATAKLNRRSPDLRGAILQVKQAADMGYVPAKIKLAWSYLFGEGVELDLEKAKNIFEKLADEGNAEAHAGMGFLYATGISVPVSQAKALVHYTMGALGDSAYAQMALAYRHWIYLEGGDGIKADNDTALRYFRKASELNNPVGQSGLGIMYLHGRGVPKDTSAAFKYFTLAANQGWVEGQLHLGFMYFGGIGIRRDFKQANKYFSLASQSGHVLALYHLGQMHAQGLGVLRSCTTAVELFKNVCERGGWGARLMLAHAAWRARDADSSLLQYLALAERGYEVAQSNAAFLLDNGEVQLFDEAERWARALQLWGRAAAQGCSAARVKLGDYHYYGLGTAQDLEAAAHHYRIASEQLHNAQATFNLGYMHERGLGLAQDLHLAKRCYDLAADTSPDARLPAALALAKLNAATALSQLYDSPLAMVFLSGESTLLSNWDLYLITALLGALGLVVYIRRPERPIRPNPAEN
ncbi:protein sel-1 homolog 1 [Hyposmocoma kahamanoa]|uniref:protein sel-1 homolog 1 n=1 Tax=Hyposmocoma kahamanoa TaxID=1477025 RepID=UPI000E6D6136|nr:protein sel-1 homolog 1 [Hyposmocoma kahamanoa]